MATEVKIRRGTAAENEIFTGAEGELTYSTDTKGLSIHDGDTVGGFDVPVLVAVQRPTAENNYTWYRKWSDGWVEQGGEFTKTGGQQALQSITMSVPMKNEHYYANAIFAAGSGDYTIDFGILRTTAVLKIYPYWATSGQKCVWEVKGYAAA